MRPDELVAAIRQRLDETEVRGAHRRAPRGDHPMTTTYGIYAPALYGRRRDSDTDAARAACLGRSLLRWTVYSRSAHGGVYAVMCVSRHWTRRAAIQAAARLMSKHQDRGDK